MRVQLPSPLLILRSLSWQSCGLLIRTVLVRGQPQERKIMGS
jgi:hypothetical protein